MRGDLGGLCHPPGTSDSPGRTEVIEPEPQGADQTASTGSRKLYLIGFMGAGKTRVGARLARTLGARFEDLDRRIEAETGASIPSIFENSGEEGFRGLETAALERLALAPGDCVIATGGGTPTRPENVETMRSTGLVFWLDPPFDEILSRLGRSARAGRPLFGSEDDARALHAARRASYAAAGRRVEIAPGEVAETVADRLCDELSRIDWRPVSGVRGR